MLNQEKAFILALCDGTVPTPLSYMMPVEC